MLEKIRERTASQAREPAGGKARAYFRWSKPAPLYNERRRHEDENVCSGSCDRLLFTGYPGTAEVKTEVVEYRHGDAVLEGYLAYDDSFQGNVPEYWWSTSGTATTRTSGSGRSSWPVGYVGFALDMYGKGVLAKDAKRRRPRCNLQVRPEADADRAAAGLDVLRNHARVDRTRIAAIGYCFGGHGPGTGEERADLVSVVSFHGGWILRPGGRAEHQGKVLALHGGTIRTSRRSRSRRSRRRCAREEWTGSSFRTAGRPQLHQSEAGATTRKEPRTTSRRTPIVEAMKTFFTETFK